MLEDLGGRVQTHDNGIMNLDKATKDHSGRIGALGPYPKGAAGSRLGRRPLAITICLPSVGTVDASSKAASGQVHVDCMAP